MANNVCAFLLENQGRNAKFYSYPTQKRAKYLFHHSFGSGRTRIKKQKQFSYSHSKTYSSDY